MVFLAKQSFEVNSLHHQAVGRIGDGLRVVAKCPDGVIEAIERIDSDRFLIGVQWHPEKLVPRKQITGKVTAGIYPSLRKEVIQLTM